MNNEHRDREQDPHFADAVRQYAEENPPIKTLGANASKVREALYELAQFGILIPDLANPIPYEVDDSAVRKALERIAYVMSFILRKDGPNESDRPYQIILQELPGEYRVTRHYTDDEGGFGQGYCYPFGEDPSTALLMAVHAFQSAY